jgi:hypothetical protein
MSRLTALDIRTARRELAARIFTARVLLFASAVPLLCRLPLPKLALVLEPRRRVRPPDAATVDSRVDLVEAVLGRRHRLIRRGCLTRGLTRFYFLSRLGLPVELCFGMGRPDGDFSGHCWVLLEGRPYRESRDPSHVFPELYRIRTR